MNDSNIIFKNVLMIFFPIIFLYAFYVQINGENTPGGGFQAGAIMAGLIILCDMLSKKNYLLGNNIVNTLENTAKIGCLIYFLAGLVPIFFGYEFLNYDVFFENDALAQRTGIFIIELGVFITVTSSLSIFYFKFK
jgi:multicomponent Na+:H+ antiporter subunit B